MSATKICLKKKESQRKEQNLPTKKPSVEDCLNG